MNQKKTLPKRSEPCFIFSEIDKHQKVQKHIGPSLSRLYLKVILMKNTIPIGSALQFKYMYSVGLKYYIL